MWGAAGYINVRWGMARNVPQMVEILNALQVGTLHRRSHMPCNLYVVSYLVRLVDPLTASHLSKVMIVP